MSEVPLYGMNLDRRGSLADLLTPPGCEVRIQGLGLRATGQGFRDVQGMNLEGILCVCVCVCVFVSVCERERERESVCVCVCGGETVCVCPDQIGGEASRTFLRPPAARSGFRG